METFEMDDFQMRLASLSAEGYHCSQILLLLALEKTGRENTDLLRALGGISKGVAEGSETCGALLGGACLLGFYAGKGQRDEREHPRFRDMLKDLAEWFRAEAGLPGGSARCADILEAFGKTRCPLLVRSVWMKAMEILEENGIDTLEGRPLPE
ncbi:putative redox-active protein with C_GCAxxG_C_C motif [Aminivibrio pyruvatiphilus]|jgi:hypothetical protein|uniref:Putative redox-active protein with C_GCAxxG_C_C motif n=1 Tax=Aminivibrio pyruvatiphilus TaxID=1005740 RepID=A0A4R8M9G4_9BACT|nr:DV_1555 family C-GCAxxG-C-C protein [Aminivibrio pyruvatiphilus]TDY61638.1 putative redox-active protein with C_GCAxxG_C_C motif [Aminivibrio pyruvatiphilus]